MTTTKEDVKHARAAEASANKKAKKLEKRAQQSEARRVKEQVEVELLLKPLRDENEKLVKENERIRDMVTDEKQVAYNVSIDILRETLHESSFRLVMRCIDFVIVAGEKHEQLSRRLTKALENADMAYGELRKGYDALLEECETDGSMGTRRGQKEQPLYDSTNAVADPNQNQSVQNGINHALKWLTANKE